MPEHILSVKNREEFRAWLTLHAAVEKECFLVLKRGKSADTHQFRYIDAVEEALCFGWIDSTLCLINGVRMQRFTPRTAKSRWSELNRERVRRLEKLGLMTDSGRAVLPKTDFHLPESIKADIVSAGVWETFSSFPPLYQRVRGYNLAFARKQSEEAYQKAFENFVRYTRAGKMYGEWNDYGRLLSY